MIVTDAQVHVWEADRPDRPWPTPRRVEPQQEGGFSAEEAIVEMDAASVDRAVIVPPSWVGENNATAVEAAQKYPARFGVMGRFDLNAPGAAGQLDGWLDQPGMLGIRLTFLSTPALQQLDEGSLDWAWEACERNGIPLMIMLIGMPEKVAPIAQRHPNLTIILDHMALDLRAEPTAAWEPLDRLVALARLPRVYVKVSSVPNFSAEPYPHRDVHAHLRRIYDAFGPHRLLGSDVTRLKGSYGDCRRLFAEALDFLSDEDRELILGRALAECLKWPERAEG